MGRAKILIMIKNGVGMVKNDFEEVTNLELALIVTNLELIKENIIKLYRKTCFKKEK